MLIEIAFTSAKRYTLFANINYMIGLSKIFDKN